jgi:hypothetical protein
MNMNTIMAQGAIGSANLAQFATVLKNRKNEFKIATLKLDLLLRESHNFSNKVTDYPIETGSNLNDHVQQEPETISLTGYITETPIKFLWELRPSDVFGKSNSRITAAFDELMKIAGYKYPDQPSTPTAKKNYIQAVEIVTSLKVYSNMVLTGLSIDREPGQGKSMTFVVTFKRVNFARSSRGNTSAVKLKVSGTGASDSLKDKAAEKKDAGFQPPKPNISFAKQLGKYGGLEKGLRSVGKAISGLFGGT